MESIDDESKRQPSERLKEGILVWACLIGEEIVFLPGCKGEKLLSDDRL